MDFLSKALDKSAKSSNANDGKQAHESQAQTDRWVKNITPSLAQIQKRLESAPAHVDRQQFLAEHLGLTLDGEISFPLQNGEEMAFDIVKIEGSDSIKSRTTVPKINGRDQNDLTKESMSDIYSLIKENGQAFPAIGWIPDPETGVIHVLDGSRRRMCCILSGQTFVVYVAKGALTITTARYIADISRLNKDLSYYEEGLALIEIMQDNEIETPKALAEYLKQPESTIQFKVNSGRLPEKLLKCIPSYNSMNASHYKKLHQLKLKMDKAGLKYTDVTKNAQKTFKEVDENKTLTTKVEVHNSYVKAIEESFVSL